MTQTRRRWLLVLALIAGLLALDLVSKQAALDNMLEGETIRPISALVPYFQITLSYNSGAAFGIFPQASNVFLVIAVIVVIGMLFFYPSIPDAGDPTRLAVGMVIAGALGNAIDRLQHGYVVDFIHYRLPALDISNVSNIADHLIVFGVLIMFYDSWRLEKLEEAQQDEQASDPD